MTAEQKRLVLIIARHIMATIKEVGGWSPASPIFLALKTQGASENQCRSIMTTLVDKGYLTLEHDVYTLTGKIL